MDITLKDITPAAAQATTTTGAMGEAEILERLEKYMSLANKLLGNVENLNKLKYLKEFINKKAPAINQAARPKPQAPKEVDKEDLYNKLLEGLEQILIIKGNEYLVKDLIKDLKENKTVFIEML